MLDTGDGGVAPDGMVTDPSVTALLKLLTFLSPAFPVGSFSYSHGLEWLIENRKICGPENLQSWLIDLIEVGSLRNDALLFAEAYRASEAADWVRLMKVAELAQALAPSRERELETMAQGRAFVEAAKTAWGGQAIQRLADVDGAAYPVAVAAAAASHAIPLAAGLPAYLHATAANLVSVGVRLVPIGQSAGLRIMTVLHPLIAHAACELIAAGIDELGSATVLADVASLRHEVQYSRVFRT